MDQLATPWGAIELARHPAESREGLRAFDAADDYLLRHLADAEVDLSGAAVVLGDRHGALATALVAAGAHDVSSIGDSFLGRAAARDNLSRNSVDPAAVRALTTRDAPPDRADVLLVRVPKTLALLEDQLRRLAPALHAGTTVVGAGMVKEIHTSTLRLFEEIVGPTRTSLAVRKARLIFAEPRGSSAPAPSPWPQRYALPDDVGVVSGRTVVNHAGIFCADRLDIGTRFFLQHLPGSGGFSRIIDLGCGNGVVGLAAALAHPDATVLFTDESYQAVASAEATARENGIADRAEFRAADGLADLPPRSADLVLTNPPFHTHRATTDATAWRMFTGARAVLEPGGELWVVGNRHLGYHVKLRRLFGNCATVAANPKFVILRAVKR
ncbi:methyltransferase [Actinomadura atramentaria]|uniref:methyltransferase n=1 Tax=Actinomadura atramentaria TaxID=1990 RepID=UPI000366E470|nr:methyltransferase [Actinomadura atramentaria]